MVDICSRLQTNIFETMLGPVGSRPSHVASFGNLIDQESANISEWIELDSIPPKYDQVSDNAGVRV